MNYPESQYIPLRAHTDYSLVDGLLSPSSYAEELSEQGFPAGALTDLNNLFAAVKFQKAAVKNGVKPILGADITVASEAGGVGTVTVLCQNDDGYRDLCGLLTDIWVTGKGQHSAGSQFIALTDLIAADNGNWIVFSGGVNDLIGKVLLSQDEGLADPLIKRLSGALGDRFYLGLCRNGHASEVELSQKTYEASLRHNIPLLALTDIRFATHHDHENHHARVCVARGERIEDSREILDREYSKGQCIQSPVSYEKLFADVPEAIANTSQVALRCSSHIELGAVYLPQYDDKGVEAEKTLLADKSAVGLKSRLEKFASLGKVVDVAEYEQRLATELEVINSMGFPGYFLVVADFIEWSRENGVPVGPGRGSGAGSLVAYSLGITDIDPLQYGLLFERFLNPERVSMPDFDIDFCRDGRDKVIGYVADKYGKDKVSQIVTFGTIAARASIRDAARVLGKPFGLAGRLAKMVPAIPDTKLSDALVEGSPLLDEVDVSDEAAEVVELAKSLEGVIRNVGKHAGGAVIAPGPIVNYTPLYRDPSSQGQAVSMYDKNDVEDVGLVKFDFLGLKTLTVIDIALKKIKEAHGKDLDISTIPLDDPSTLGILRSADTTSVFQLESSGMKDLLVRLKPDNFEDLIALVALFRPGPLGSGMVDDFIDRKHGRKDLAYPHPLLESVLEPTYGVILYQEQVMQAAQVLSGFTLGGADLLRRAMGKKKPEEMEKQRASFVEGAKQNGIPENESGAIFDLIEKFAGYGFNKSHSAAYALLSYQTAYLKAHYPAAFSAAVLTADQEDTDKLSIQVADAKAHDIKVLPPSVNLSSADFGVSPPDGVTYSLAAVKGLSPKVIGELVSARGDEPFEGMADFLIRAHDCITAAQLKKLALSGALDEFAPSDCNIYEYRAFLDNAAAQLRKLGAAFSTEGSPQAGLFDTDGSTAIDDLEAEMKRMPPLSLVESDMAMLNKEYASLGLYLSKHPVELMSASDLKRRSMNLADFIARYDGVDDDRYIEESLIGVVVGKRTAGPHAFITIDDGTEQIDVPVFERTHATCAEILNTGEILSITGTVKADRYTGKPSLMANEVSSLSVKEDLESDNVASYGR